MKYSSSGFLRRDASFTISGTGIAWISVIGFVSINDPFKFITGTGDFMINDDEGPLPGVIKLFFLSELFTKLPPFLSDV